MWAVLLPATRSLGRKVPFRKRAAWRVHLRAALSVISVIFSFLREGCVYVSEGYICSISAFRRPTYVVTCSYSHQSPRKRERSFLPSSSVFQYLPSNGTPNIFRIINSPALYQQTALFRQSWCRQKRIACDLRPQMADLP
jgi:hypothetical protein